MFENDPIRDLLLLVTAAQAAVLALAFVLLSRAGASARVERLKTLRRAFGRIARRPALALSIVFLLGFALAAGLSAVQWPVPRIHDEFSYRLAGETFALGRMTNPTNPMWPHLETEHVLHEPTYMSKYPPGQGVLLAAGYALAGEPMLGVWLGLGAAAAAVCWMFYGFLPARWAFLGGLLIASHPGMLAWWGHSAWGGQLAMLGGALVYGALTRIVRGGGSVRLRDAVLMGVGLAVLANMRPYEGFAASLPAAALLGWRLVGLVRAGSIGAVARATLPVAAVLAAAGSLMLVYNQQVTGDPLKMPYQLHTERYCATPLFLFQSPPERPEYRDRKLEDFHAGWEYSLYERQRGRADMVKRGVEKVAIFAGFYLGPALGIGVAGLFLTRRSATRRERAGPGSRRWLLRFAGAALVWSLGASLLTVWFNPHYAAPAAPLALLLGVAGLRRLSGSARAAGNAGWWSLAAARGAVLAQAASAAAVFVLVPVMVPTDDWSHARDRMERELTATGERHLVIVRSGREFSPHDEWVYNGPEIDAQAVVWARALDSRSARRLSEHFSDRKQWLLQAHRPREAPDLPPPIPELVPYTSAPAWLDRPARTLMAGEPVGAVALADLDGDGVPDVVAAHAMRGEIWAFLSSRGGAEGVAGALPAPAASLTFVQLSGSRKLAVLPIGGEELLAVRLSENGAALVCEPVSRADADGMTASGALCEHGVRVAAPGTVLTTVAADLTGDGVIDAAWADFSSGRILLRRGGRISGTDEELGRIAEPLALLAADLNGDGLPDLVAAGAGSDELLVLIAGGGGKFLQQRLNTGVGPVGVAAADIDGDGRADLVAATRHGHGITVLRNLGPDPVLGVRFAAPAEATLRERTWFADKALAVAAVDVDGDGVADVLVGGVDGAHLFLSSER